MIKLGTCIREGVRAPGGGGGGGRWGGGRGVGYSLQCCKKDDKCIC